MDVTLGPTWKAKVQSATVAYKQQLNSSSHAQALECQWHHPELAGKVYCVLAAACVRQSSANGTTAVLLAWVVGAA